MGRLGFSRDLSPWLAYGCILALSSHGLFSMHMKSLSVSTSYNDILQWYQSCGIRIRDPPWRTSLVAQTVKRLPTMWETWVQSLGWEDLLEKEMAPHSSILAWKIQWMEEPGRLQSMGSQRVGHDWVTFTFTFFLFFSILLLLILSSLLLQSIVHYCNYFM